ncbi:hypothetical protein H8E88_07360 [candidate division KSB1 bacterium]|nr:hypothetical protein [candidate division KSB1 bacterium]MBL7094514.1 hypothetical protein [candidate division KSB1 bacterium]
MRLSVEDILEDLHAAEREIQPYEKKYHMRSEYFYELYKEGLIEDKTNFDFQAWAGIYEIKLDRERLYKNCVITQNPFRESLKELSADGVVAEEI